MQAVLVKAAVNKTEVILYKNLKLDLRKKLVKTLVCSILLYGSETCMLKQADIRRLGSCEMWHYIHAATVPVQCMLCI